MFRFKKKTKEPWKILNISNQFIRETPVLTVTSASTQADRNTFISISNHKAQPFKHQDPKEWIVHYNVVSKANGWSDQKKLDNIPPLFQEAKNARDWFAVTFKNAPPTDYKTFCDKLIKSLAPSDEKYVAYTEMNKRKQQIAETAVDYYFAKLHLITKYNPSLETELQVNLLVDGLLPQYKQKVFGKFNSPDKLFAELKTLQAIGVTDDFTQIFYANAGYNFGNAPQTFDTENEPQTFYPENQPQIYQ